MMAFSFKCDRCGELHDIPAYHADRTDQYWDVPEQKRDSDVFLTSDSCVIADRFFFIHGCLEIPVVGANHHFTWGVWVSLSKDNFLLWEDNYEEPVRRHVGPFFGWLCTRIPIYPDTLLLKTSVYLRDNGIRPRIVLEPTEHPLAVEQAEGDNVAESVGDHSCAGSGAIWSRR